MLGLFLKSGFTEASLVVHCGFVPTALPVYTIQRKDSLARSLGLTFKWPARYKNETNYAGMGVCHLCENISSIDAFILMTRLTFASHTLELDKYRRKMSWLISVSSGMYQLQNLPQQLFAFKSTTVMCLNKKMTSRVRASWILNRLLWNIMTCSEILGATPLVMLILSSIIVTRLVSL